jgi:hypothetical protein
MKWLLCLMALFAFTASAADISGNWKGTAETPNGTVERTFVFKVDGHKLTGETTSNMFGKSTIEDGKVDGDDVSFSYHGEHARHRREGQLQGQRGGSRHHQVQDRGASRRADLGNDRQARSLRFRAGRRDTLRVP